MADEPEIFMLPADDGDQSVIGEAVGTEEDAPEGTSSPHQRAFDDWVASGVESDGDTHFVYHHWVESMPLPVIVHRADGTVAHLNPRCKELLNRRRRDVIGRPIKDLFGADWYRTHTEALRTATTDAPDFESHLRFQVGEEKRLYTIMSTVLFTSASEVGVVWLVLNDVTEQVQANDELRRANQMLKESNRDLEEFAYVASHDLQEPLRKIQAFGDRLRARIEDDADEKALDYLSRMESASQRMHSLINDLLSFSRVTTTGRTFEQISLAYVVKSVLQDLEIAVADANATVHVGQLPMLDADEPQMKQLMQNLIGNALKFRDADRDPEIWIEAAVVGPRWLISIRDNGIGFEQEYADKIFTVFQRLHGRSAYEGTGVGLAICRKIVERHGGTIRAMAEPGEGATFLIDLPRPVDLPRAVNQLRPAA